MITSAELCSIEERAYIPEHLPGYVTAINQSEPYLIDDYVIYKRQSTIILVGYPLSGEAEPARLQAALEDCRRIFKPRVISLIAPQIPPGLEGDCPSETPDDYYRLDLSSIHLSKKLRSLLKRAERDLLIERQSTWRREHQSLVQGFLQARSLDRAVRHIFTRLPDYIRSETAWLVEARDRQGRLIAFDIADFSAGQYAFYLFNFLNREHAVPGASDLLLAHLIAEACKQEKRYLNLGLGINPGVVFFKLKWGSSKFLPYRTCVLAAPITDGFEDLVNQLLR